MISKRTPYICSLTPAGKYVASDYQAAGGSRLLAKRMIDAGYADGSALTISGKTLAEEAALAKETPGQDVIATFEKPIKPNGGLVILKGNLAPEGCVMKIAAAGKYEHRGPARVFDCEEDCFKAVQAGGIKPGDVVVIRYEGPKGGPGMREMLQVTAAISSNAELSATCGAAHRRPLQRRDARIHRGPRGSGGVCRRAHCRGARGRHHLLRHSQAHAERGDQRRGDGGAAQGLQAAGAALAQGRLPQVCGSRDVGIGRRDDVKSREQGTGTSENSELGSSRNKEQDMAAKGVMEAQRRREREGYRSGRNAASSAHTRSHHAHSAHGR